LDILSLENNFATSQDDIQLFKDFIFHHSDALRGKWVYSSNATIGSAVGIGMVAAAAAAAASASSGKKTVSAPGLPGFDKWLCCAHLFQYGILVFLHLKQGCLIRLLTTMQSLMCAISR
jgi:hypothetical protein